MTATLLLSIYLAFGVAVMLTCRLNAQHILDLAQRLRRLSTDEEREDFDAGVEAGARNHVFMELATVFIWPWTVFQLFGLWVMVKGRERRAPAPLVAGGLHLRLDAIRRARIEESFNQVEDVFAEESTVEERQLLNRFFEDTKDIFRVVGMFSEPFVSDQRIEVTRAIGSDIYEGVWSGSGLVMSVALRVERSVTICTGSQQDVQSFITLVLSVATGDLRDPSIGDPRDLAEREGARSCIASYMYEGCALDDKPHWHGHLTELFDSDDPNVPEEVFGVFNDFFETKLGAALRSGFHGEPGPSA